VAWAAGVFEGEGSITLGGNSDWDVQANLGMTDRDVMERFQNIVGFAGLFGPYLRRAHPAWTDLPLASLRSRRQQPS
jgi:hypothetical protein